MTRRWLFADQLGPQFLDAPDQPHHIPRVMVVGSCALRRGWDPPAEAWFHEAG